MHYLSAFIFAVSTNICFGPSQIFCSSFTTTARAWS